MRKRLLLIGLVILLAAPLVLLLRDFTREVLLFQLYRIVWSLRLLFETLPQVPLWFLFLLVVLFLAARSLVIRYSGERPAPRRGHTSAGQIRRLARWIERTVEGEYSRWSLSHHLGELTLDVLAYGERSSRDEVRRQLREGQRSLPPEVAAYLEAGFRPAFSMPTLLSRLKLRQVLARKAPLDPTIEAVAQFLEFQLHISPQVEVDHDHRSE